MIRCLFIGNIAFSQPFAYLGKTFSETIARYFKGMQGCSYFIYH